MNINLGARTQAIVLLLLVGTSGALAGVVGDRLLLERGSSAQQPAAQEGPPGGPPGGQPGDGTPWRWEAQPGDRYADRLAESLELTAAQRAAIDSIVDEQQERVEELNREIQPRFRAIAQETRAGIEAVLTEEQRQRLRSMREDRMRVMRPGMREMMRERRDDGRPEMRPEMRPDMRPDGRPMGPGMRPPPGGERMPGDGRMRERLDSIRGERMLPGEDRMRQRLDSIRGDRPLMEVRDSILRARGDTARLRETQARRDSIMRARRGG
jgi:Spy/CpxP family protein refolding chaperone